MKEINPLILSENYPPFTNQFSADSTPLTGNFQICQELDKYKHLLYMYKNEFNRSDNVNSLTSKDFDFIQHVLNLKTEWGLLKSKMELLKNATKSIETYVQKLEELKTYFQTGNKSFDELIRLYSEESDTNKKLGSIYDELKDEKILAISQQINSYKIKKNENSTKIKELQEKMDLLEKIWRPEPIQKEIVEPVQEIFLEPVQEVEEKTLVKAASPWWHIGPKVAFLTAAVAIFIKTRSV